MNELTAKRLRELFTYDSGTGHFHRKISVSNWAKAGQLAGTKCGGYIKIMIDEKNFAAHRLAWLYCTGAWPTKDIDHLNGVKHDNRIDNLRDVTRSLNIQNQRNARLGNCSGYLGASWDQNRMNWKAQIKIGEKTLTLGRFLTPQEAHEAYLVAKRKLHEGCTI